MACLPADGSENDNVKPDASSLRAEVEALRHRLAALEARLPEDISKEKRRASTKPVVRLTAGAMLAMLASASIVYGQSAVDALFISKDGNIAIGPSGAFFVGKEGNVAIGPSRLDPNNNYKLHVSTSEAKTSTNGGAGFAVTTNEAGNPFGLGIRLTGAPGLADRSAVLVTADVNLGDGGHLVLQPSAGNVGIGTMTPKAENKLEVNGQIAANSLNVANSAMTTLNVAGSAYIGGLKVPGMGINGTNALEFGAGVEGKEAAAGQIAYQKWTTDALDIVGAGTTNTTRKIKFFAEGGATLAGSLNVSGEINGNVVYQRDNDPQTTYQKPLWRYHMTLTGGKYGGKTRTIPKEILTKLCGTPDGCEVRLGTTRWDGASRTETESRVVRFYYSPSDGRWRSSDPWNRTGVMGDGKEHDAMDTWNHCRFTDGTYDNYQFRGNQGTGMQLYVQGNNPAQTCELTLIP
jgi:hypothetical protein